MIIIYLYKLWPFPILSEICADFVGAPYTVDENSGVVSICVEVTGQLEDSVSVKLFTIPVTANGKTATNVSFQVIIFLLNHFLCSFQ